MSEYIERQAAITIADYAVDEHPYKVPGCLETYQEYNQGWNDACDYIRERLEEEPAADVAPVRHGRWEPGNPICPVCGENKFKDLDADVWADWQPKFCPNCGALMREVENGEK